MTETDGKMSDKGGKLSVRPPANSVILLPELNCRIAREDSEQVSKANKPWGRWNPTLWVHRPDIRRRITDLCGTEEGCAIFLGVSRSTLRGWLHENKHRDSIPKALEPKLDEYLNKLEFGDVGVPDAGTTKTTAALGARPLVALHADISKHVRREIATMAFRRDNLRPQTEGDPFSIDYHIGVHPMRIGAGIEIGIASFWICADPREGRRGIFRPPATETCLSGVKISRERGTPDGLNVLFEPEGSQKGPLRMDGLGPPIPLGSYDNACAGEGLTIRMIASLRHGFVSVRIPPDGETGPGVESMNRKQVLSHLGKRAILGDLSDDDIELVVQNLSLKAEPR